MNTKRAVDLLFSLTFIILTSPITLPVIIILKFTGEKKIFYKQKRVGLNNHFFYIWKFASMLENSPNIGTGSLTLRDDPRVTKFGHYLRKTKINEFPQMLNVVIGDMSIVGPRPQMEVDFNAYPKEIRNKIYSIKPGITSIGSIVFRDEEAILSKYDIKDISKVYEKKIAPYKGLLEIWYRNNMSLKVDMIIVFVTIITIFNPNNNLIYKIFSDLPRNIQNENE